MAIEPTKIIGSGTPVAPVDRSVSVVLQHRPRERFRTKVSPLKWGVYETDNGFELLPIIEKFRATPGVQGVDYQGNDRVAMVEAEERHQIVFIDNTLDCCGQLIREHRTARGLLYLHPWENPRQVGNASVTEVDYDLLRQAQREVKAKYFPNGPDPVVYQKMIREARQLANIMRGYNNPSADRLAKAESKVQFLQDLLSPPKPKAKKATKAEAEEAKAD